MHKAVRITALQQMPNYRKPASFLIKETYPLPPYSSVIGLVHNMCGWTGDKAGYRPMAVSIQGSYASTVSDYATNYAFGPVKYEPGRHAFGVDRGNGELDGISRGPKSYELLTDVSLIIHIMPEKEALVEEIAEAFINPPVYPSLGRYEDLLQIVSVEVVELEIADDAVMLNHDAYVPTKLIDESDSENLTGTIYKLGKVFGYTKKGIRRWDELIVARHICANTLFFPGKGVFFDEAHNEAVFPA